MRVRNIGLVVFALLVLAAPAVRADPITVHGVTFPQGFTSFADVVVSYDPFISGSGQPTAPYRIPGEALGAPDYPEGPTVGHASLGDGGSITLGFTDNSLTGSGTAGFDLWIFEVGPDVEDTFVEISKNGTMWFPVGKVYGATSGIDIDAFGFGPSDFFSFVRLTDDTNEGDQSGASVGADIDAIGAISSAPPVDPENPVPEPASLLLFGTGLLGARLFCRRRR
jgi:hypothetical protein